MNDATLINQSQAASTVASKYPAADLTRGQLIVAIGTMRTGFNPKSLNLRGLRLAGVDLSGVDLTGCDLAGADLRGCRMHDTILADAVLDRANLNDVDARGADLTNASMLDAQAATAQFHGANLTGVKADRGDFSAASFGGADLTRAKFNHADIGNADFTDAKLESARFDRAWHARSGPVNERITSRPAVAGDRLLTAEQAEARDAERAQQRHQKMLADRGITQADWEHEQAVAKAEAELVKMRDGEAQERKAQPAYAASAF